MSGLMPDFVLTYAGFLPDFVPGASDKKKVRKLCVLTCFFDKSDFSVIPDLCRISAAFLPDF